jgi:8-oxo-dGTP pyrophosphatase MutT (NUDIX family)
VSPSLPPADDPSRQPSSTTLYGRFVVVPAAYVFLLRGPELGDDTEVLLQLRSGVDFMDGHWAAAAAGHVERGETAYDAARREALEEIGVTDVELEFVTAMQRTAGGEPIDERIDFFFTSRSWRGRPRVVEADKAAELRWCRLGDLPEPVVPHERVVLEGLRTGRRESYSTYGF